MPRRTAPSYSAPPPKSTRRAYSIKFMPAYRRQAAEEDWTRGSEWRESNCGASLRETGLSSRPNRLFLVTRLLDPLKQPLYFCQPFKYIKMIQWMDACARSRN